MGCACTLVQCLKSYLLRDFPFMVETFLLHFGVSWVNLNTSMYFSCNISLFHYVVFDNILILFIGTIYKCRS